MKRVVICLFGDYHTDDRVLKKAESLSKKFKVTVISVNKKNYPLEEKISNNLHIKNKFIKNKLKRHFIRFCNFWFWKQIVKENPADIYDCNDPDTIMAGIYAKKYYNSKIVYDAHELWSDVAEKQKTVIKTMYSFISSNILYWFYERPFIKKYNAVITVNESIKSILKKRYNLTNIFVIYNYSNYDAITGVKNKDNTLVFIGGYRLGVEKQLLKITEKCNLDPMIIGFNGNHPEIKYLGFLDKQKYRKLLRKNKLGFCSYDVNCKSTYYATPNKLFQYLQAEVPIIAIKTPGTKIINEYEIGETYKIEDENDLITKINLILKNYDKYLRNIKKYKFELSWEYQEHSLLKIYEQIVI
ncbi:MAG: glycosyltransferase [Tissierellia bacterium]|nr:glycosyltransferase [Tissierellia bacterium]